MIEVRPVEVYAGVAPRPKVLLKDHWVKFSDGFPSDLKHVKGKTFQIDKQQQVVYDYSWTLKEACYTDVDLSNDSGIKLYPYDEMSMYEMLIGFYPGYYRVIPYFPANQPIYRLDEPTMSPLVSDANLKYLSALSPRDSPVEDPILKLYLVYRLKPVILRLYVEDGKAYEKCAFKFIINRCVLKEARAPDNVVPKPILYLDEIKGGA